MALTKSKHGHLGILQNGLREMLQIKSFKNIAIHSHWFLAALSLRFTDLVPQLSQVY